MHKFLYMEMLDVTASYGMPFDILRFLGIHIIDDHSCMNYCIFTKLSQIMCLLNIHILICQHDRLDSSLRKVPDSIAFYGNFHILLQI